MPKHTKENAKEICKFAGLNEAQIDTIINGWDVELPGVRRNDDGVTPVHDFFERIVDGATGSERNFLKDMLIEKLVIPINTLRLDKEQKDRVLEKGVHTVICVMNMYSSSIGASITKTLNTEFVIGIGSQSGGIIINQVVSDFSEGKIAVGSVFEISSYEINGASLRGKLIVPSEKFGKVENIFYYSRYIEQGLVAPDSNVLLIVVGDKQNVLPGEEGYDVNWDQTANWYANIMR